MANDIYMCKESAMVTYDGQQTLLRKGHTRVRAGHELLAQYPDLFEPLTVHYDVVEDTSARTRDTGRTDAAADEPPAAKRGPGRPRKAS